MMKALATLATYRYACLGIDMNGSHGGIKICKSDYTEGELKSIIQKYAAEVLRKGSLGRYLNLHGWLGFDCFKLVNHG